MVANKLSLSGFPPTCRSWSGWMVNKVSCNCPSSPVSLFLRINGSWLSRLERNNRLLQIHPSTDTLFINYPSRKFRVSKVKSSMIKFSSLNNQRTRGETWEERIRTIHVALKFLGFESKNECPIKRLSSIRGSHLRFTRHPHSLFSSLFTTPPCLSSRGERTGTGHSGGKYSWRRVSVG